MPSRSRGAAVFVPVLWGGRFALCSPAGFADFVAAAGAAGFTGLRAVVLPRRTGARSGVVGRGCLAVSRARVDMVVSHGYRAQQFRLDTDLQPVIGQTGAVEQEYVFDALAERIDPRRVDADPVLGQHARDGI